jgi:hypothetical protein
VAIATQSSKVISEKIEVEVIKTIFHWHSTYKWEHYDISPNSHCLLRIYFLEEGREAVVIASHLYSNDENIDLYHGYPDLVKAAITAFPKLQQIASRITWLAHSGQFSVGYSWAESHQSNSYTHMDVKVETEGDLPKVKDLGDLKIQEVIKLLKGANLEPAVEVLRQLEHDNWGRGPVDEEQVKGCWELEEGIIEGKKRMKGLIGW